MSAREYTLVEIIRDPRMLLCEASELTREGHYYLYRYNGLEGDFSRATVPSGAAEVHFQALKCHGLAAPLRNTASQVILVGGSCLFISSISRGLQS